MKNLILILLSFILCANTIHAQEYEGSNLPTIPMAKEGYSSELRMNVKELYFVLQVDNTVKHGKYMIYTTFDSLLVEGNFKSNKRTGDWKYWYSDAPYGLKSSGSYTAGEKSGEWTEYYNTSSATKKATVHYSINSSTASGVNYFQSSAIESEGDYLVSGANLFENGSWKYYYPNRKLLSEGTKKYLSSVGSSVNTGKWTYYNKNGDIDYTEEYNANGKLDGEKIFYENGVVAKTEIYANGTLTMVIDKYTDQKEKLEKLGQKAAIYETGLPKIYSNEVKNLISEIAAYNATEKTEAKFKTGETLEAKLTFVTDNYETIKNQSEKIQQYFTLMETSFKQKFPKIYDVEVKPFENNIATYKECTTVKQMIDQGNELFSKMENLNNKFTNLTSFENDIETKIKPLADSYNNTFPLIYESEIQTFLSEIKSAKTIENIDSRIEKTEQIILTIDSLNTSFNKLVELDVALTSELVIVETYKNLYNAIYTKDKNLIEKAVTDFAESNSIVNKLKTGTSLVNYLGRLKASHERMQQQTNEIKEKADNFELLFKDDKDNKYVYKRGLRLYEVYMQAYDKQAASTLRESVGRQIMTMLDQLIALKEKDNTELNEALKYTQTPEEMKKAFGFE